ncbi:MAG: hypothetical protein ACFFD4_12565 [Candidatus Odinarchaeota archaeon]
MAHNLRIAVEAGVSEDLATKNRQKALKERVILPFWQISRLGNDHVYQICFRNTVDNQQLANYLETFPKVKVMKSADFCRYLLFLPAIGIEKLSAMLIEGEKNGDFSVLWRRNIVVDDKTRLTGVNLNELLKKRYLHAD